MQIAQQIIFLLISVAAIWFFTKKSREIVRNIKLGRDEDFSDNKAKRWNNVLLLAFGQKKMFRNPLVAVLHFFCLRRVYNYQYRGTGDYTGRTVWNASAICRTAWGFLYFSY